LAGFDIPLFLSFGGSRLDEIKEAIAILNSKGAKRPLVLMHGFQSYPTLIEHSNLLKMEFFAKQTGLPVGFADHIDGDHRQRFSLCAMAIGMGACVIEKHITFARSLKMEDYESALDPTDFVEFVEQMRELDAAKGDGQDKLIDVEAKYRQSTRKHVAALRPIAKGSVIGDADVTLKRAVCDQEPVELESVLGRKAGRDIAIHEAVLAKDLI
jgi:sialic acid synthase SpsE